MTGFYTNGRGMPKFLRQKLPQINTPFYSWRTALLVLVFVCFQFVCLAQESRDNGALKATDSIKPLEFGDEIPEELWQAPLQVVNHPEGKEVVTLDEYRGKLIILDFWATWCSSCIKGFPKMNDLQNAFNEDVKILAATTQELPIVTKFFESSNGEQYNYMNSVVNGGFLKNYFPHTGVPHLVWIDQEGKVINTTLPIDASEKNIQAVLDKKEVSMRTKIDIDRKRPLFLSEKYPDYLDMKYYSIFSKGYVPGIPSGGGTKTNKQGEIYGWQRTNATLSELFRSPFYHLFPRLGLRFNSKHVLFEVENPDHFKVVLEEDGSTFETDKFYNYEIIVPDSKVDSLFDFMLQDLNRYSDYTATIEERLLDTYALIRTSNEDKIKSSGEETLWEGTNPIKMKSYPISALSNILNSHLDLEFPIIEDTGYKDNIDLQLSKFTDLFSLREALREYDLDLVPVRRKVKMVIIKDK